MTHSQATRLLHAVKLAARSILFVSIATVAAAQGAASQKAGADSTGDTGSATPGATPTQIKFSFSGGCLFDSDAKAMPVKSVADLAALYNDGAKWAELQSRLIAIIGSCGKPEETHEGWQIRRLAGELNETLLVTFVVKDVPYYVVVPQPQPYSLTIPGKTTVVPVVLIASDAHLASVRVPSDFRFMSTESEDPRQAQIPGFFKQIIGAGIGAAAPPVKNAAAKGILAEIEKARPKVEPRPAIWAYAVTGVGLPFKRATITEKGTLTLRCDGAKASDTADVLPVCPEGKTTADVAVSTTYTNTPKTHLDFTAVAGAVIGAFHGPAQMKVDSGKYASDPTNHAMTMAAISWRFKARDPSLPGLGGFWDRLAAVAGGVITPSAGVGVGLSGGIVRGFAVNGGALLIWVPTSANGAPPGRDAATDAPQLSHKANWGFFLGANYVFKE